MTNSFLNKVAAERSVLSVVNARTSGKRQLTGLSSAAIEMWRGKVGTEATKDVVGPLVTLADLCQRLSEQVRPLGQGGLAAQVLHTLRR